MVLFAFGCSVCHCEGMFALRSTELTPKSQCKFRDVATSNTLVIPAEAGIQEMEFTYLRPDCHDPISSGLAMTKKLELLCLPARNDMEEGLAD